ncbi:MAG: DNA internalization-related competence protein ComEC/Rec2 [Pseudomonadota bacterium]
MITVAIGFVLGAWLLQQQAVLPGSFCWLYPLLLLVVFCFLKTRSARFKLSGLNNQWINHPSFAYAWVFLTAFSIGFCWAATIAQIRLSDELPADWQQKSINIVGVIANLPEQTEHGERFEFDVEKVLTKADDPNKTSLKVPRHLSLSFYPKASFYPVNAANTANSFKPVSHFHAGQRWQLSVKLKRPHGTYNPHGLDFEAWALAQNIRATGSISNKSGNKKWQDFVLKPTYLVEYCREKIANRITQSLMDKPYAGVIRALVVGDDSQIKTDDWTAYLRTGTNHLMSISGLHITMLAGLAFAFTAFIWRRIPSLVLLMPTRRAATIAGLIIAILYACLAGLSVPTQRTLFMLMTFALALLLGRNLAISRALAIALMVVVLIDPWAVIAPGFWLSFCAVALIAYVTVGRLKAPHWLAAAVHTQWAITLGLLPILIVMFGQTSIVSPLANAFAIPIISLIVVPLSILGSLLPGDIVLHAAHTVLQWCMLGLNWLASLPIAVWQQAAPPVWAVLVALLGILWLLLPRGFPQRWLGFVLVMPLFFVSTQKLDAGAMQVNVLDVGQGLSVVVKTASHVLLYDAGSRFSSQNDAGNRIVLPYLRGEGINRLHGFIISHNDADHSGGAASVLAQIPVNWLASSFEAPQEWQAKNAIQCVAGQTWYWDKVKFEVLNPGLDTYENASISDNNRSCVLKIISRFGSILLTGDIEKSTEAMLLQANKDEGSNHFLASDVLVAPHHGSKTSSTRDFVDAVGAKQVIFTVGYLNRFKHPKPMIEQRYANSGAANYRSDYHGALQVNFTNNHSPSIESWRQKQPRYWHDSYPMTAD